MADSERLDQLEKLVESNARAIEALSNESRLDREEWKKDREEWKKDRRLSFDLLARLASSQANFWETQADYYRRLEDIEERQATMVEILDRITRQAS